MSKTRSKLRDLSGTTLALTSLAVMGAAAVVSAPVWLYYRRKRKRTDALLAAAREAAAREPGPEEGAPTAAAPEADAAEK